MTRRRRRRRCAAAAPPRLLARSPGPGGCAALAAQSLRSPPRLAPARPPEQPMKVHKKAGGDAKRIPAKGGEGEFEDEELECRDCQAKFVFTVGEQQFFAEKGFDNKPVRAASERVRRPRAQLRLGFTAGQG
jgi:hypothetical protein